MAQKKRSPPASEQTGPSAPTRGRVADGALFNALPLNRAVLNQAPSYLDVEGPPSGETAPKSISSQGLDDVPPPLLHNVIVDFGASIETTAELATNVPATKIRDNVELSTTVNKTAQAAPIAARGMARVSARAELTLTPKPVTIVPTPYPNDPHAPLVVHGSLRIDLRSTELREFNAKIDELIRLIKQSNEIAGDTRDQLLAEIAAGRNILAAPRPNRSMVEMLLVRSLQFIAAAAAGGIIAEYANEAAHILQHLMDTPIPI